MINKTLGFMVLSRAAMGLAACGGNTPAQSSRPTGLSTPAATSSHPTGLSTPAATSVAPAGPTYDLTNGESITYWCPNTDTAFFEAKVAAFKAAHPEFKGDITWLATVGEGEVKAELTKDPEEAADVFEIADDNIKDCVEAQAIYVYNSEEIAYMKELYGEGALAATTVKGKVYGIPYRNDNGYCLAYDKSVVSDEQAQTMEGIIAACKAANCLFNYDLTDGWYSFSPVWAAGGNTYTDDEGVFHADIATEGVAKAIAGLQQIKINAGGTWNFGKDDSAFGGEGSNRVGALILHNNENAWKAKLGDNLGIAKLPTYTVEGQAYQLKTFQGYKALGIRRAEALTQGKRLTAKAFTMFMGSDAVAEDRLVQLNQGVSNKAVAAKTELWKSKFVSALASMGAAGYTVAQASGSSGSFWDPAAAIGTQIKNGTLDTPAKALTALQKAKNAIENPVA